jgi:hypothetical protein
MILSTSIPLLSLWLILRSGSLNLSLITHPRSSRREPAAVVFVAIVAVCFVSFLPYEVLQWIFQSLLPIL